MSVLIFLIVLYILLGLSMMKLFEKAGLPGWKALVPGVAAIEWCKLIGRKPQYALWLLFPIVNIFIYCGMVIDLLRSFGKHGFWDSVLAVVFAPIPYFMVGRDPNAKYEGPILEKEREYHRLHHEAVEKKDVLGLKKIEAQYPYLKKSQTREWTEAIIFAVCRRRICHRGLCHCLPRQRHRHRRPSRCCHLRLRRVCLRPRRHRPLCPTTAAAPESKTRQRPRRARPRPRRSRTTAAGAPTRRGPRRRRKQRMKKKKKSRTSNGGEGSSPAQ